MVQLCLAQGFTVSRTARLTGVMETTLRKYYGEELQTSADKAISVVARTPFSIATDRNHLKCALAAIFLLRAKGGWRAHSPSDEVTSEPMTFSIDISNAGAQRAGEGSAALGLGGALSIYCDWQIKGDKHKVRLPI